MATRHGYGMAASAVAGRSVQSAMDNLRNDNEILVKIVKDLLKAQAETNPELIIKYSDFLAKDNNE